MTLKNLRRLSLIVVAAVLAASASVVAGGAYAAGSAKVEVVATFSILADFVRQVGGDRVSVVSLVPAGSDPHGYRPRPGDVRALSRAGLLVENGAGFEGWNARLAATAGFRGPQVVATEGIALRTSGPAPAALAHARSGGHAHDRHRHGFGADPHAWLSLRNAVIYVANIREGLCRVDAGGCAGYPRNAQAYAARLQALDAEIGALIETVPAGRRTLVTLHAAFSYFAADYGLAVHSPQGVSTEGQASARDLARIVRLVRDKTAAAVFVESGSDPRLIEQIARETRLPVSGPLYPGSLSGDDGPAATYLDLMRHNATIIVRALRGDP